MFLKYFESKEVYIKLHVKIAESLKNAKFSKEYFFMNFQDMIIGFDLGENTSLGSVLKKISYSQNPYCRKAPTFCPHRRKKAFLRDFFNFRPNFSHSWSTSVHQNFHDKKPQNSSYKTLNLIFSYLA